MMRNIIGVLVSFGYIFIVIITGAVLSKQSRFPKEFSRKWIHILVGNWIFIAFYYFDSIYYLAFVPAIFIIINYVSYRFNLIEALETDRPSLGTVWYAVSLLVVSLLAYALKKPIIAYVSVLIMAYGDGLAAIIGLMFGTPIDNDYIENKSIAGLCTVLITSGIITALSNQLILGQPRLVLTLITAVLAALIELLSKKGFDNLFLPIIVAIFYAFALKLGDRFLLIAVITMMILAVAYYKKALTYDGVIFAFLHGIILYGFGGFMLWLALIVFFVIGTVQSKITNTIKKRAKKLELRTGGRTFIQVIANAFPACMLVSIYGLFDCQPFFLFGAFICFSVAAADTLSSEIGMLSQRPAVNIINFRPIATGLSGGVTWMGFNGGLLGSVIIALLIAVRFNMKAALLSIILGLLGAILDSVLGSVIQRKYIDGEGIITEKTHINGQPLTLYSGFSFIDNNAVNLLTTCVISSLSCLIYFYMIN